MHYSLKTVLCIIRLSCYDSDVFYKFKKVIIEKLPYTNETTRVSIAFIIYLYVYIYIVFDIILILYRRI